ncbi:MAG TPA: hypothetical protein DDY04_08755 [Bacteroidales bacterium]|nr:hypothetical protein [Bacteroidales bacterium]
MNRLPFNNYRLVISIVSIISTILTLSGCDEGNSLPRISTLEVSNVDSYSAACSGKILDDGGSKVINKGICWNTAGNPTLSDFRTIEGNGTGDFTSTLKGLSPGTTYFVRAYATNQNGTTYGNSINFKTTQALPTLSDISFALISGITIQCTASVISDGGQNVITRGFCWSKNPIPTIADSKIAVTGGIGTFSCTLENLESDALYYIRAYATTGAGTSYSIERTFTTASNNPALIDNDHLLPGNPSNATTNLLSADNYLMMKPQYCLSYNNTKQTANWVAWHLNTSWMGSVSRQNDFRADNTLPATWYHVTESDYYYSQYGFDRGHICPSADRTATVADNSATFLMTNMVPQTPNNNQIVWENFESYCRNLTQNGSELYLIAGPHGAGGTSAKGTFSILKSGVTVPALVWKIALVLPNGNNDLSRITATTRVIAIVIPNNQECSKYPWTSYRVSVDSIEHLTGFDFFRNIPYDIQNTLEVKVDNL